MRHIIDEIVLDLGQLLLAENDVMVKINVTSNTSVKIMDGIMNRTELKM